MRARLVATIPAGAAAALLAALLIAALLAGCGGAAGAAKPTDRPITAAQTVELARVLVRDYGRGGARLDGTYLVQHQTLEFSGAIDFRDGSGTLSLRQPSLPRQPARTFYWTRGIVLAQLRPGASEYLAEQSSPQGSIAGHLIAFLQLLASPAIGNIQLLESRGVDYLGSAHGIDRFRYGRLRLSVVHATDLLETAHITEPDGSRISARLLTHAPQRIVLPARSQWMESG